MNTRTISEHVREQTSVSGILEERALIWMAQRLPSWITSDHLTLLGLLAMLMAGVSYWLASWDDRALFLVILALALNWFGDSLDGTVARVRNKQRPRYGYYVDHAIDIVGALFLLGGLAASGYMTPLIALGVFAGYVMVCAEIFMATYALGVFRLAFAFVGATELRILLAIGTLFLFDKSIVHLGDLGTFLLFDVGGVCAITGMLSAFLVSTVRNTRTLYQAEPLT